jgi:hypothetical protein
MTHRFVRVLLAVTLMLSFLSWQKSYSVKAEPKAPPTLAKAQESIRQSKGFFTENKGQWDPEILFIGDTSFGKVAFTEEAIYYSLMDVKIDESVATIDRVQSLINELLTNKPSRSKDTVKSQTVKLSFVNPNKPKISGYKPLSHYSNYFTSSDQSKWGRQCRNFTEIYYQDIWNGIDLKYFFSPEGMKYEYYVKPEADIQELQIKVEGADLLKTKDGIELQTPLGTIQDNKFKVYTQSSITTLKASMEINGDILSFSCDKPKTKETIVIDPIVYSTYLGGSTIDYASCIVVDQNSCAYVAGYTFSSDFPLPTSSGNSLPGFNNNYTGLDNFVHIFVIKLSPNGTNIEYATYLGTETLSFLDGNGHIIEAFTTANNDSRFSTCTAIAVDLTGCAYLTGFIRGEFPFTVEGNPHEPNSGFYTDVFITKLNTTGGLEIPSISNNSSYSRSITGSGVDVGTAITVDRLGYAYVVGISYGWDLLDEPLISSMDSFHHYKKNGGASNDQPTLYGLFVPGFQQLRAKRTQTTTDPLNQDAFVIKINRNGTALWYFNYIGGSSQYLNIPSAFGFDFEEIATCVAVKEENPDEFCVYIGGMTRCRNDQDIPEPENQHLDDNDFRENFPIGRLNKDGSVNPGFNQTQNGDYDGFVIKLDHTGEKMIYSTYLGGSNYDSVTSISIDNQNCAYITGETKSSDFYTGTTIPSGTYNSGTTDCFVAKLSSTGTNLDYFTYLGGTGEDIPRKISLDNTNNAYITGYTTSTDLPSGTFPMYNQPNNAGGKDGFLFKLNNSGTLTNRTYFGGTGDDLILDSALGADGAIYLAGATTSDQATFPGIAVGLNHAPGYNQTYNGNQPPTITTDSGTVPAVLCIAIPRGDAFVTKLALTETCCDFTMTPDTSVTDTNPIQVTFGSQPTYTFTLTNPCEQQMIYYFSYAPTSNITAITPPFVIVPAGQPSGQISVSFTMPSTCVEGQIVQFPFYITPQPPIGSTEPCCPVTKIIKAVCIPCCNYDFITPLLSTPRDICRGGHRSYYFKIKNTCLETRNFTITPPSSPNFDSLNLPSVTLAPGEISQWIIIKMFMPSDSTSVIDQIYTFDFTIQPISDPPCPPITRQFQLKCVLCSQAEIDEPEIIIDSNASTTSGRVAANVTVKFTFTNISEKDIDKLTLVPICPPLCPKEPVKNDFSLKIGQSETVEFTLTMPPNPNKEKAAKFTITIVVDGGKKFDYTFFVKYAPD